MGKDEQRRSAARDYVMARILSARAAGAAALASLDEAAMLFCDPEDDSKGKTRAELLENADDAFGMAATAVQQAQERFNDIDPAEGEPEVDDDEEDEDDDKRSR